MQVRRKERCIGTCTGEKASALFRCGQHILVSAYLYNVSFRKRGSGRETRTPLTYFPPSNQQKDHSQGPNNKGALISVRTLGRRIYAA